MKRLKLGITALRKYRGKAENWTDAAAYRAETEARAAGVASWGTGKPESFDGKRWTVDGSAPVVVQGAPLSGSLLLDGGCARCGEPMDAKATRGLCSPCEREVARKQDAMIAECAMLEAA